MAENGKLNGWNEWSRYVLKELERLNTCYEQVRIELGNIKTEVTMLKVKAGFWGLLGGAIPIAIALLIGLLKK